MWNDLSGASPGDGQDEDIYKNFPKNPEAGQIHYENGRQWIYDPEGWIRVDKTSYSESENNNSSLGILGEGHGLNIWEAANTQVATPEMLYNRSKEEAAETMVKAQFAVGGAVAAGVVAAAAAPVITFGSLYTAAVGSSSVAVSGATYTGGGTAALTLGGGNAGGLSLGAGGFSSALTIEQVTTILNTIRGAIVLNELATKVNTLEKTEEESNNDQIIYRSMRIDINGSPLLEESARGLGVRPGKDILIKDGFVFPFTGGMSASPDDPNYLPNHRKPISLGGTGKDPVFYMNTKMLPPGLKFVQDSKTHGTIQPSMAMSYEDYKTLLSITKNLWKLTGN